MFHFGSQIIKEFYILTVVRRTINSTKEMSDRVPVKSMQDCRKFNNFKGVDTWASYVMPYVDAADSSR